MNHLAAVSTLRLATVLLAATQAIACSSNNDASIQGANVVNRVEPTVSDTRIKLSGASFDTTGFSGEYTFDNVLIGTGTDRVASVGTFDFSVRPSEGSTFVRAMKRSVRVNISENTRTTFAPSGLFVRYSEPINLGVVEIGVRAVENGFPADRANEALLSGQSKEWKMFVLPGRVTIQPKGETAFEATIEKDALATITLPTTRVHVALDPIDAQFPLFSSDSCGFEFASVQTTHDDGSYKTPGDSANVRRPDGSAPEFVVSSGGPRRVHLRARNLQNLISQNTHSPSGDKIDDLYFHLNRLEVDDVQFVSGNSTVMVKGTYVVYRKDDRPNPGGSELSFYDVGCVAPTKTSMDVPDGTYEIRTTAETSLSRQTSVRRVSFP